LRKERFLNKNNMEDKLVVGGDSHYPFESPSATSAFIQFIRKFRPDTVILNGDILDCYELSKYLKVPSKKTFKTGILKASEFLETIRSILPDADIRYVFGNHEQRYDKTILCKLPEMFGNIESLDEKLPCKKLGISVHKNIQSAEWTMWHNVAVGHFDRVCEGAGMTALRLMMKKGNDLVQSHTHRLGATAHAWLNRTTYAYEAGCLCSLSPPYDKNPDWQSGFLTGFWDGRTSYIYPVPIKGSKTIWIGQ
jgi:predicted phosphodiesterase